LNTGSSSSFGWTPAADRIGNHQEELWEAGAAKLASTATLHLHINGEEGMRTTVGEAGGDGLTWCGRVGGRERVARECAWRRGGVGMWC
jgi:hypothetical protein